MSRLFVYGTLRHLPHLEVVAGDLDGVTLSEAFLPDHSVRASGDFMLPVLVSDAGASAPGLLLEGLNDKQRARLEFYEDGYNYKFENKALLGDVEAGVYIPPASVAIPSTPWILEEWVRRFANLFLQAAREVMMYQGRLTPAEIVSRMARIRTRAGAAIRAKSSLHGAGTLQGKIEIDQQSRPYSNFLALDEYTLRHERFSGGMSETLLRAVTVSQDAALVLPYDPVRDRVLVVEQFRMGLLARGDKTVWHLEPIAGVIDPGETPEEAAHREALEEAGLRLSQLLPISQTYASPGNITEFHYLYLGLADLPDKAAGLGGAAEEDEDIRGHILTFERLMQMVHSFEAANGPLVLAALWLARERDALRGLSKPTGRGTSV